MPAPVPIGEIIESGTTSFLAQCLEVPRQPEPRLYDPPPFGSFVKIERRQPAASAVAVPPAAQSAATLPFDEPDPFASPRAPSASTAVSGDWTYALVCSARTTSLDPFRRPTALGLASEDEMRRSQPQIFELLRTEFTGMVVGYVDSQARALRRHLPPVPPRLHARVYPCTLDDVRAITSDLSFLRAVLAGTSTAASEVPAEELAGACLRAACDAHSDSDSFLVDAARQIAKLIPDEYDRLQAILRIVP